MATEAGFSLSYSERRKRSLRRELLARRAALSPEAICRMSAAIAVSVCSLPAFTLSQTIMAYMALPYEVQTAAIIANALRQGKRVVVPRVVGDTLVAVEYPREAPRFCRGAFGILEPSMLAPRVAPAELDCVLVPGVGFDRQGTRLGFGRGYYDRFLRQVPSTVCYGGLAFHSQIVACIPRMSHDVQMHFVVSEQGVVSSGHVLPGNQ